MHLPLQLLRYRHSLRLQLGPDQLEGVGDGLSAYAGECAACENGTHAFVLIGAREMILCVTEERRAHGEIGIDHELDARVGNDAENGREHAFVESSAVRGWRRRGLQSAFATDGLVNHVPDVAIEPRLGESDAGFDDFQRVDEGLAHESGDRAGHEASEDVGVLRVDVETGSKQLVHVETNRRFWKELHAIHAVSFPVTQDPALGVDLSRTSQEAQRMLSVRCLHQDLYAVKRSRHSTTHSTGDSPC